MKVYHLYEKHPPANMKERSRRAVAESSWKLSAQLHSWVDLPYADYKRDSRTIGDNRKLPFLRDLLQMAVDKSEPESVLILSNDDTIFHPWAVRFIVLQTQQLGAISSSRVDTWAVPNLNCCPHELMVVGTPHIGRDMFAFTREWLTDNLKDVPDFLLGAPMWDLWMTCYIRLKAGIKMTDIKSMYFASSCELPHGLIYHLLHVATWQVNKARSNNYNHELFYGWQRQHMPHFNMNIVRIEHFPPESIARAFSMVSENELLKGNGHG